MIVIDSSIWIGWLRGSTRLNLAKFDQIITGGQVLVGDVIILEVLRGSRDQNEANRLESLLSAFPIVGMLDANLAIRAAANYRRLRQRGTTIRSTIDLIIATYCIENGHHLLADDRDYLPMAEHLGLRLV